MKETRPPRPLRLIARALKNPAFLADMVAYARNDALARLGLVRHPYRIIFVAGLPKSGTTWVMAQLARISGYNIRTVNDPEGVTKSHDISASVFESLPAWGYSIIKLHTRYTEENFALISRYCPRFVVTIRDLRDVCVSRFFHVRSDPSHRHHALYHEAPKEEALEHCIDVIELDYVPWIRNWIRVAADQQDRLLLVRYEDLSRSPKEQFERICAHFEVSASSRLLDSMASSRLSREKNLEEELHRSVAPRAASTARKGSPGEWREHMSPANIAHAKKALGPLLIDLGYEETLDW